MAVQLYAVQLQQGDVTRPVNRADCSAKFAPIGKRRDHARACCRDNVRVRDNDTRRVKNEAGSDALSASPALFNADIHERGHRFRGRVSNKRRPQEVARVRRPYRRITRDCLRITSAVWSVTLTGVRFGSFGGRCCEHVCGACKRCVIIPVGWGRLLAR